MKCRKQKYLNFLLFEVFVSTCTGAYSEACQTSMMGFFAKIVHAFQSLFSQKNSMLDVLMNYECAFEMYIGFLINLKNQKITLFSYLLKVRAFYLLKVRATSYL